MARTTMKVTDPELLAQLEGTQPKLKKVDNPELIAQLEGNAPHESKIKNAILGFAARGNEAMAALNPWADQEKIEREQEWVKQHEGAGIGETIADIAMTLPAGGVSTLAGRALATGAIEGLTNVGDIGERIKETGYSALGSGIGEKAGDALTFLIKPFKESANAGVRKLIQKAEGIGIDLNAAQKTGNKTLQYADSALDFIPSSSSSQQAFKEKQRSAWQKALMKLGNESSDNASPEAMGAMKDRIQGIYRDVSSRNNINIDDVLRSDLAKVKTNYMEKIPVNQKSIVKSYLKDFGSIPDNAGAQIKGTTYQEIRSMLDKQAKNFKNTDEATYRALKDIRKAVDDAMERSVSPSDLTKWKQANNDWMIMKNVEGSIDPLTGDISPAKLLSSLARKDQNRVLYGKGDQELTDVARVGKEFITPKTADAGTAQRAAMMKLLTGAGLGGVATTAYYNPELAGAEVAAGLLGGILIPKVAARSMQNGTYLTKGLMDIGKEVIPGVTREKIIQELMRNAGVQIAE